MILQRYVFRELLASFITGFLALTLVMWVGVTLQTMTRYDMVGLSFVLQASPYMASLMIGYTLPVAALTASTLTFGRMASENEIVAVRASGIHIHRIIAPALFLGVLLAALGIFINSWVVPNAHFQRRVLLRQAYNYLLTTPPATQHQFNFGRYRIIYGSYGDGTFKDISIVENKRAKLLQEVKAKSGTIYFDDNDVPVFKLKQVTLMKYDEGDTTQHNRMDAGEMEFPLVQPEQSVVNDKGLSDYSRQDLEYYLDNGGGGYPPHRMRTELHRRYAFGLAPLLLLLVGIPIGIYVRKGSRMTGIGASLPPLVLYFGLMLSGTGMASKGKVPVLAGVWAADIVLIALAGFLLFRIYRR